MKALLYSPYSLIARHVEVEREITTCLLNDGWHVDVITCDGALRNFCTSMASIGLDHSSANPLKQLTCKFCRAAKNLRVSHDPKVGFYDLESWITSIPMELVMSQISNVTQTNWSQHAYEGVPLGRLAAVDLLMHYKVNSLEIPPAHWRSYIEQLELCYKTFFVARAAIRELAPDRVLVYNTLFGLNHIVKIVSEESGCACYSIHLGFQSRPHSRAVMLYRDDDSQIRIAHTPEASQAILRPCSSVEIREASEFYRVTLKASSHTVYSSQYVRHDPQETREKLGLLNEGPVITVPLASADERFALSLLGLPSLQDGENTAAIQAEWLHRILNIAEETPEWQFVIRPHPRMFPNHRDSHVATEASRLIELLETRPDNVQVNLPGDGLSLANVFQISDVVLGGTSSAGLEALAYGLPVITHDRHRVFAYPAEIGFLVNSSDQYTSAIEVAILGGWSIENVRLAIRWMSFLNRQVAREMCSQEKDNDVFEPSARFASTAARVIRERRLFSRLPDWLATFSSGIYLVGQTKRDIGSKSLGPGASALSETLRQTLGGLHQVGDDPVASEANETAELQSMLSEVLDLLGEFRDERCLSSKISNYLTT